MLGVFLSVVCFASVAVLSQSPRPCVAPQAWESKISYWDPVRRISIQAGYTYDAPRLRRHITERTFVPGFGLQVYDLWFLWNERAGPMMYRFNQNNSACARAPIRDPWRPFAVPPNAQYYTTITMGTQAFENAGVDVYLFGLTEQGPNGRPLAQWEGQFTVVGCVPFHWFFLNLTSPDQDFMQDTFYDTTLGIADPGIFNLPASCTTARVEEIEEPVRYTHRNSWFAPSQPSSKAV
jgi:hypothetical protein